MFLMTEVPLYRRWVTTGRAVWTRVPRRARLVKYMSRTNNESARSVQGYLAHKKHPSSVYRGTTLTRNIPLLLMPVHRRWVTTGHAGWTRAPLRSTFPASKTFWARYYLPGEKYSMAQVLPSRRARLSGPGLRCERTAVACIRVEVLGCGVDEGSE